MHESKLAGTVSNPSPVREHELAAYRDVLMRFALSRVAEHATAEDLVQESMLAALKSQGNFAGRSSLQTWLTGILRHKILDYYRRNSRENRIFERSMTPAWYESLGDESGSSMGALARQARALSHEEFWDMLQKGLAALPERTAAAFMMREVEQLDSDTICEQLKITRSNLWVMIHRAKKHLQQYFCERWEDAPQCQTCTCGRLAAVG